MSEKRFTIDKTNRIYENGDIMSKTTVVAMLNSLSEENEQLRKELDTFKPVMFQDVRKGTVILYSKGDSNE